MFCCTDKSHKKGRNKRKFIQGQKGIQNHHEEWCKVVSVKLLELQEIYVFQHRFRSVKEHGALRQQAGSVNTFIIEPVAYKYEVHTVAT